MKTCNTDYVVHRICMVEQSFKIFKKFFCIVKWANSSFGIKSLLIYIIQNKSLKYRNIDDVTQN